MKLSSFLRSVGTTSVVVAALALATSCGSDGDSANDEGLLFHGEGKLLDGFKFDTGPQPSSGPASVTLRLSGAGTVKVDARGSVAAGKLAGRAGTGQMQIEAHVKLDGTLKIDTALKKSTGDIPGLKDIDVPITGTASFDPFLLEGGTADVTANIPETKLPDIPLGSVPGKLRLTIVGGSQLVSKFHANCMTVTSGSAQYDGEAETSGTILLKGTIVLELPSPLNKEIELPEIKVPIPSAKSKVEFAAVATAGAEDGTAGACSPSSTGDASVDGVLVDSSSADTKVVEDTSSVDSGSGDSDMSPDDSVPPSCSSEAYEPDGTNASARVLTAINDCDGSAKTVSGVLSTSSDIDVMRFDGDDTFGCAVDAYAKVTGPAQICIRPVCTGGTTEYQGCAKGYENGERGCCGTEVESKYNCNGTTKDSARVYITVRATGSIASCSGYSVQYHF
jgi:hypothetical protein